MKEKVAKTISMLTVTMLLCLSIIGQPVRAAEMFDTEIMPLSLDAASSVTLSINSGTASARCSVRGDEGEINKIVINMYLQKKNSNGYWSDYKSWYATKYSYYHTLSKSCSVTSGTYRVKVRVICYNGTDAETKYLYTSAKTY